MAQMSSQYRRRLAISIKFYVQKLIKNNDLAEWHDPERAGMGFALIEL